MYTTSSFSEKAYLNAYYLKYLNPCECEEQYVGNPSPSVIDTFDNLEFNPYASPYKGFAHKVLKPVRFVVRMAYTIFIAVIVAPLGIIYHTTLTLKHLICYSFKKIICNPTSVESLDKMKKHAACLATDFWTAFQGVVITAACIALPIFGAYLIAIEAIGGVAVSILGAVLLTGVSPFLLGGMNPQKFIPSLVADPDNRIGMYIALKLRHDLGLVGDNGTILPFNSDDNVRFTKAYAGDEKYEVSFTNNDCKDVSKTIIKFAEFIIHAELDLIDQVRAINSLFDKHGVKKVEFQYPINEDQTVKALEKQFKHSMASRKEKSLLDGIKLTQRKIQVLREIFSDVRELAVKGGYAKSFFQFLNRSSIKLNPIRASFIDYDNYYEYFYRDPDTTENQEVANWNLLIRNLENVTAIDPEKQDFDADASVYEKFKYKIGVSKFQAQTDEEIMPLHELLFLNEAYSGDQLNKQYRHICMKIHPDKYNNSPESNDLLRALNAAKSSLEESLQDIPRAV